MPLGMGKEEVMTLPCQQMATRCSASPANFSTRGEQAVTPSVVCLLSAGGASSDYMDSHLPAKSHTAIYD